MSDTNLSSFIWSVADLLRGDYKQSEYGRVILPLTVLRRLDCVLEPTKPAVLAETDVINMVSRGIATPNIIKGIHLSVATRIVRLLMSLKAESPIVLTGGLGLNKGMVQAVEELLALLELFPPEVTSNSPTPMTTARARIATRLMTCAPAR